MPLDRVAQAAGYRAVRRAATAEALAGAFAAALSADGPAFLLADVEAETGPFTAPRVPLEPTAMRDRFTAAIAHR